MNLFELEAVYELEQLGQPRAASIELVKHIEKLINVGAVAQLNMLFEQIDLSDLTAHSLVMLVRSTARINKQIPLWQSTYERAWIRTGALGHDPKKLFVGLDDLSWVKRHD